jgi:hypothetical protein
MVLIYWLRFQLILMTIPIDPYDHVYLHRLDQ